MEVSENELSEYIAFTKSIAWKVSFHLPAHVDRKELMQQGLLGLAQAMDRYDTSFQLPFKPFAARRISGAIFDFLRQQSPLTRTEINKGARETPMRSLSEPLAASAEDTQLGDVVADTRSMSALQQLLNSEETNLLVRALDALTDRERQILEMYYEQDKTFKEIAAFFEVSQASVWKWHAAALTRLRTLLVSGCDRTGGKRNHDRYLA